MLSIIRSTAIRQQILPAEASEESVVLATRLVSFNSQWKRTSKRDFRTDAVCYAPPSNDLAEEFFFR